MRHPAIIEDTRGASDARYTATAQALHWISAALLFLIVPFGWVVVARPEENGWSQVFFTLHKSFGLIVFAATAFHVVARRDGIVDRMLPPQIGAPIETRV